MMPEKKNSSMDESVFSSPNSSQHNRYNILLIYLKSLLKQTADSKDFKVFICMNNSALN